MLYDRNDGRLECRHQSTAIFYRAHTVVLADEPSREIVVTALRVTLLHESLAHAMNNGGGARSACRGSCSEMNLVYRLYSCLRPCLNDAGDHTPRLTCIFMKYLYEVCMCVVVTSNLKSLSSMTVHNYMCM